MRWLGTTAYDRKFPKMTSDTGDDIYSREMVEYSVEGSSDAVSKW